MVLDIVCIHAGVIVDKLLNDFAVEEKEEQHSRLLKFCTSHRQKS